MEVGLGVVGMAPRDFWALTIPEFNLKFAGWREFNCPKKGPSDREAAEIADDMAELLDMFPDGELPRQVKKRHKRNKAKAEATWRTTR